MKAFRAAGRSANVTHGMTQRPEYRVWTDMRRRCYQPQRPDYHRYGGRGIKVCDRWRDSFENFFADMGPRPEGKTLERRENDGDYGPDNCCWESRREQLRNMRTNRRIAVFGETMTLVEASERYGLRDRNLLRTRLARGWDAETAVTTPPLTPQENMARRKRDLKGKMT
jgi:hypothetical protein